MHVKQNRLCPVKRAKGLDNSFRRLLQNPQKILKPYIQPGMTVMDIGFGPGFFTLDMAKMVGETGRVIAVDLQEEMLLKVKKKISGTELENRITLYRCTENKLDYHESVDFVLLFYAAHEIPKREEYFKEIATLLKPIGQMLIVEPPFHVTESDFEVTIEQARHAGFKVIQRPRTILSKVVLMTIQ